MNVFDIIGPVMVGPSSSHTAGAVRIGYIARKLLGEPVKMAKIGLSGSFLATGRGHGTDRALVAGLLGMKPDDGRIPDSFRVAEEVGMSFDFVPEDLPDAHPNTASLDLVGIHGTQLEVVAASIGGGRVKVTAIDGVKASFYADCPTLIVQNQDQPGCIRDIATMLAKEGINIATLQLGRDGRGGNAVAVIELDHEVDAEDLEWLKQCKGVNKITYWSMEEDYD